MKPKATRTLLALTAGCAALFTSAVRAETELVVAAYPPLDESVKLAIPRFERLHPGVKVKLVSRGFGDHHNAMITALASGTGLPDVMAVEVGFIGRFAESRELEDLGAPPYDGAPLLERSLPLARAQGYAGRRVLAAMPAEVGPGTLFYRKDLVERAGVTEEELTRSWDSFLEAGRKIKESTGASLVPHAWELADVYLRGRLKDGQATWVNEKGWEPFHSLREPAAARFREAFELARRARAAGLDARVGAWSKEWAEGLRAGRIASVMSGAWLLRDLEGWIAPETKGLWHAAQLPGGARASFGGSLYTIPKRAAHKAEAWSFIRFMCFDRLQQVKTFRRAGAWPALLAAQEDPLLDEPLPFLGGQPARRVWKAAATRIPMLGVTRCDPLFEDVYRAELEQVLEKGKPVDEALMDARQQGPWGHHVPKACPYQTAPTRRPPGLRVASPASHSRWVELAVERWGEGQPNVRFELVSLPAREHHQVVTSALRSGTGVPDVMVIELDHLGDFAGSKALADLAAKPYAEVRSSGREPVARVEAISATAGLTFLPADVSPGTLFYRKDLLDRAGITEEELTRSWDSFLDAGKKIRVATGAVLVADAGELMDIYLRGHVAPGGHVYLGERGGPAYRSAREPGAARFRRAFELAKRAREEGLDARVQPGSEQWVAALREGTIAAAMGSAVLLDRMHGQFDGAPGSQWRAAQLPGQTFALLGGAFYAISKKCTHKQEAAVFLRFLAAPWGRGYLNEGMPHLGGQQARRLWNEAAARVPALELTSCDAIMRAAYEAELEQVLDRGKDIDRALVDAAAHAARSACQAGRVRTIVVRTIPER